MTWTRGTLLRTVCCLASCLAAAPQGRAAGKVVLGERHFWRKHYTFFPPSISAGAARAAGLATDAAARARFLAKTHDLGFRTPPPAPRWTSAGFDDADWLLYRGREFVCGDWRLMEYLTMDVTNARLRGGDPFMEQIGLVCQRGRFLVTDRRKVGTLTLSLTYRGGFVAYLNGKEVARKNLPAGAVEPTTPADDYPRTAWFYAEGKNQGKLLNAFDPNAPWPLRERTFGPAVISSEPLREGLNVLAVELHRSDYPVELAGAKYAAGWQRGWATLGLSLLTLSADGAADAVRDGGPREAARPRAWTVDITTCVSDRAAPNIDQKLSPLRIEACRNGSFSGQVIVSDARPLEGLSAKVSALRHVGGGSVLRAQAITVRYGATNPFWKGGLPYLTAVVPVDMKIDKATGLGTRFDVLRNRPPAGARTVPVWITVNVPRDLPAGRYRGELTISWKRAGPFKTVVHLSLADWALPDRKDYVSLMNIYQSPETLAAYYKVPPWSEAHWKLIDKSMRWMARAGNIGIFLPLLARSQRGNDDSYVQWIPQTDGTYRYDFTRLDRYVAAAMKHHPAERLRFVCLVAWGYEGEKGGKGPVSVTVRDPTTGGRARKDLPPYGTPEAKALWKPLLWACRDRLKARGLADRILIGMSWDMAPKPKTVAMFREILPEAGWLCEAHMRQWAYPYDASKPRTATVPVKYNSVVWGGAIPDPAVKRLYGWRHGTERLTMNFNRAGVDCLVLLGFPVPWAYHMWMESTLACGRNGNGNVGGDYWRIVDLLNKQGRLPTGGSGAYWNGSGTLYGIYPLSNVGRTGVGNNTTDLFGPGPDGPVSTVRFENALENNQESEARIFLERALLAKARPLPADLARRCQALLDERTRVLRLWARGGGRAAPYRWQDRTRRLFEAAAEVARTMGK